MLAIAISGLAHRIGQLSQLSPSCMSYKRWYSVPAFDTDVCPRFTVPFDGLIRRARGVTAYLKD